MMTNKETRVYWDDLSEAKLVFCLYPFFLPKSSLHSFYFKVPFAIISNANKSDTRKSDDKSSLWISYEDAKSARKKAEYVKKNSFGGVSIWSLDMDDFKGWFCNLNAFPIIESIKEEFEHKFILVDVDKNNTTGQISTTTKRSLEAKTTSDRHIKVKTASTVKNRLTHTIDTTKEFMANNNKNIDTIKKNNYEKTNPKNGVTSIKEISKLENIENETTLNSTSSKEEPRNEPNLDAAVRSVKKKFKAVREIRLHACLNKKLCNLGSNHSSKIYFQWPFYFVIYFNFF